MTQFAQLSTSRNSPALSLNRLGAPLLAAGTVVFGCVWVWFADPTTPGGASPICPTKLLLGIDCPGCGTLRMVYSLLHGDLAAALAYNALNLAALLLVVPAFAMWTYERATGGRVWNWNRYRWIVPTYLVLALVWFVARNLPFAPFTGLYV